jgi:hypothetical protein
VLFWSHQHATRGSMPWTQHCRMVAQ